MNLDLKSSHMSKQIKIDMKARALSRDLYIYHINRPCLIDLDMRVVNFSQNASKAFSNYEISDDCVPSA